LQYNQTMKTATLPPIRVTPEFRLELEGLLEQDESLSQFVEKAVCTTVAWRKTQAEFVRRGMAAIEATRRDDSGVPAAELLARLEGKLAAARKAKVLRGG
jgi:predicted transcriptional regulator